MKRILSLLLIFCMCLTFAVPAFAEDAPVLVISPAPTPAIKVACVGDSITFGAGIKKAERKTNSYPVKLQGFLGDKFEVVNFGVNSLCLSDGSDLPYTKNDVFGKSLDFAPDIVVIMLGTNDTKTYNWEKFNYKESMDAFLAHYTALPSNPRIFLMAPPPAYNEGAWDIQPDKIPLVRDECIKYTKENNIPFIDIYSVTKDMPEHFEDNIHPDIAGTEIIAKEVEKALKAELEAYPNGRIDLTGASEWAVESINKAYGIGLADKAYFTSYTNSANRDECAMLAVNLCEYLKIDIKNQDAPKFTDIADSAYKSYIEKAYAYGVMQGTGAETFEPAREVTRQEFATLLFNILTRAGIAQEKDAKIFESFKDSADIAEYAKPALSYMCTEGIMKGDDAGMLLPKSFVTKEQSMAMLVRISDAVVLSATPKAA